MYPQFGNKGRADMEENTKRKDEHYFITAYWGRRAETPEEIAKRFLAMIDAITQIVPTWKFWVDPKHDLESLRGDFVRVIKRGVVRDDRREIEGNGGYRFGVYMEDMPKDGAFSVLCHAGKSSPGMFQNQVIFSDSRLVRAAPEFLTYRIFHAVLLAIVDAWAPDNVEANCGSLVTLNETKRTFRPCWMRYLCPALARQAHPPAIALVEHLPNGGLVLSATHETFDVDNPSHVSAAMDISAALEGLEIEPQQ